MICVILVIRVISTDLINFGGFLLILVDVCLCWLLFLYLFLLLGKFVYLLLTILCSSILVY